MKTTILFSLVTAAGLTTLHAALPAKPASGTDWPSYRGPNGNGSTAADFGKAWNSSGPKKLWKAETSNGFSSITVGGNIAATLVTGTPAERHAA